MSSPSNKPTSDPTGMLNIVQQHAEEAERRGLSRLAFLLKRADPVALFAGTAASMMFGLPEELTEAQYGTVSVKIEHLAFELYPHFGRSPAPRDPEPTESTFLSMEIIQACQEALDDLLLGRSYKAFMASEGESDDIIRSIRGRTAIVRGNAYPPQTERRIREVQGQFDEWYAKRVGIAPTRALEALRAILKGEEDAFNEAARSAAAEAAGVFEERWHAIRAKPKPERDAEESRFIKQARTPAVARMAGFASVFGRALVLHVPALRPRLEPALTDAEWNTLLSLIGLTTEAREQMREPIEVRNRPLYVLPDGRVLLVDVSNAFDALWEAFDAAARQDRTFYDTRYQRHAAHWLEERIVGYLRRLFPDGHVYKTLDYPDPGKGLGATAELDAAVVWGPFLLLVEAKARQFRLAGQLGDVGRLRTDLKQNVEDAFDQAPHA